MRPLVLAALLAAGPAAAQERTAAPIPALLEPSFLLSIPRVVDPDPFRGDGAVLGAVREIAIPDMSLTAADQVFVPQPLRGRVLAPGDLVQLYRIERRIHDPVTGERLGRLFLPSGVGRVDSLAGDVARLRVTHAFGPILIGDFARAVAEGDTLAPAPGGGPGSGGYVVAAQQEKAIVAPYDRLLLRADGPGRPAPGDVVVIYRPGDVVAGRRLPDVVIGRAMVVRGEGALAAAVLHEVYRSDLAPGDRYRPETASP